jgi:hypothetical protein
MNDSRSFSWYSVASSDSVVRRQAALRPVGARRRRLQLRPEHLEINDRHQPLQLIARYRQCLQPLVRIEEPRRPTPSLPPAIGRISESAQPRLRHQFSRRPSLRCSERPDTPAADDRLGKHTPGYTRICGTTEHIWCSNFDQGLL